MSHKVTQEENYLPLIQTDSYLLIVDDSEIKDARPHIGKYYYDKDNSVIGKFPSHLTDLHVCKKIIAHLPLNGTPVLKGVDLLPPIEDEVDRIYEDMEDLFHKKYDDTFHYYSFVEGYNKAKEKYKFTEEDIMSAMKRAVKYYSHMWDDSDGEKIIQSIQQLKTPVAFECEMDIKCWCMKPENGGCAECNQKPKTTTNSQGQTMWVGKYIFND